MINSEELDLLVGEEIKRHGYVFLENAQKPSSSSGKSIPIYYLLLTNKRLFFFNIKMENISVDNLKSEVDSRAGRQFAVDLGSRVLSDFTLKISEIAGPILNFLVDNQTGEPSIDLTNFISNKESFVISLLQIERCQLFNSWLAIRGRYVRLELSGLEESNKIFCIYCIDPLTFEKKYDFLNWFQEVVLWAGNAADMVIGETNAVQYLENWAEQYTQYRAFKSSSLGIVFEYPKNWITEEQSPNNLLITNTPKKVYGLNGASFELYLVTPGKDSIFPRSNLPLDDIVRNEVNNQMGKKDQFELVGINDFTINGIKGRSIEYLELNKNVKSNKIMEYIIITHEILYLMFFSAPLKTYDFYKPQINHILNSIQLING